MKYPLSSKMLVPNEKMNLMRYLNTKLKWKMSFGVIIITGWQWELWLKNGTKNKFYCAHNISLIPFTSSFYIFYNIAYANIILIEKKEILLKRMPLYFHEKKGFDGPYQPRRVNYRLGLLLGFFRHLWDKWSIIFRIIFLRTIFGNPKK